MDGQMGMVVLPKSTIVYMHVWCCDGVDGQMEFGVP